MPAGTTTSYVILFVVAIAIYYLFKGRAFLKMQPTEVLETFIDTVPVDPSCANITAVVLLNKYNGDINRLTEHLHAIGATPEIVSNPINIPKLATILQRQNMIKCP